MRRGNLSDRGHDKVTGKRGRDLLIRRRDNITPGHGGDVLQQRYWVFHLGVTGDVVETYLWYFVDMYHWDVLLTYNWDVVGCFIWDVPASSLGRTKRHCFDLVATSCCRVGTDLFKIKEKITGFNCYFFFYLKQISTHPATRYNGQWYKKMLK